MTWIFPPASARLGIIVATVTLAACGTSGRDAGPVLSAADSAATANEVRASLAGEAAPGAQAYSYRGLYAGIARTRLESFTLHLRPSAPTICEPSGKLKDELTCKYDVRLGPDSAPIHVEAVFGAESQPAGRLAREITAVRELPLDVDGVHLARDLADAFERQTALLDKRDASFGHHQAQVRMGTVNGVRLNYVDMSVSPRGGREVLMVKMSRSGAAPQAKPAPVSQPATPNAPAKTTTQKPAEQKKKPRP